MDHRFNEAGQALLQTLTPSLIPGNTLSTGDVDRIRNLVMRSLPAFVAISTKQWREQQTHAHVVFCSL